ILFRVPCRPRPHESQFNRRPAFLYAMRRTSARLSTRSPALAPAFVRPIEGKRSRKAVAVKEHRPTQARNQHAIGKSLTVFQDLPPELGTLNARNIHRMKRWAKRGV